MWKSKRGIPPARHFGRFAGLEWKGDNRGWFLPLSGPFVVSEYFRSFPPCKQPVRRSASGVHPIGFGDALPFRSGRRPRITVGAAAAQAGHETEPSPEDPLMNRLERFLDEKDRPGNVARLVMDAREPFPEQRFRVLERRVTELGGRILSAEDRTVLAEISPDTDPTRLEGLFHWERRPVAEDSDG